MVKVLAVASGGGHWTQMMRLREAFLGQNVVFVGVKKMYRTDVVPSKFYAVSDVSRLHKWSLPFAIMSMLFIILKERPSVIVTTGSAPGMLALRLGKMLGSRTVWIDSIANAEQMSLSGQKAKRFADLWLTQWPHLASEEDGPTYLGSIL
jgi:UDP-N-acetylglucosamine:LPS N-acetylglucosamine transferase